MLLCSGSNEEGVRTLSDRRRFKKLVGQATAVAVVAGGLVLLSWPALSDYIAAYRAQTTISRMEAAYDAMQDEDHAVRMAQAHAYNDRLGGVAGPGDVWDYDDQLVCLGEVSSMMAWVDIPKIDCRLPVYHHTTESVLMAGVGHVDTTALPVGGEGTLCALSGHSGMSTERMFDDIRKLEVGDCFVIWTLGEPFAYEVFDVRTVDPTDASILEPQTHRDLCALITCTPLNVNTHRLVVTGERCAYKPPETLGPRPFNPVPHKRVAPVAIGGLLVISVGISSLLRGWRRRVRQKNY